MADKTHIEWTEATWNPIIAIDLATGKRGWHCVHKSDGCKNCYAEALNGRLGTGRKFASQETKNVEIKMAEGGQSGIDWPLRARKPRRIFVCSMTDLFADFVPDIFIDKVFAVMALSPRHTFQILTKRPDRMREYLSDRDRPEQIVLEAQVLGDEGKADPRSLGATWFEGQYDRSNGYCELSPCWEGGKLPAWPLPNVWLGVSVEDQKTADERIPLLLQTPAAVRWVSQEPQLAPICYDCLVLPDGKCLSPLTGLISWEDDGGVYGEEECNRLNWVVVGGESGSGARPFDLAWALLTVQQCCEAETSVFVKQLGSKPLGAEGLTWRGLLDPPTAGQPFRTISSKGGDIEEWPQELRVRQWPKAAGVAV